MNLWSIRPCSSIWLCNVFNAFDSNSKRYQLHALSGVTSTSIFPSFEKQIRWLDLRTALEFKKSFSNKILKISWKYCVIHQSPERTTRVYTALVFLTLEYLLNSNLNTKIGNRTGIWMNSKGRDCIDVRSTCGRSKCHLAKRLVYETVINTLKSLFLDMP